MERLHQNNYMRVSIINRWTLLILYLWLSHTEAMDEQCIDYLKKYKYLKQEFQTEDSICTAMKAFKKEVGLFKGDLCSCDEMTKDMMSRGRCGLIETPKLEMRLSRRLKRFVFLGFRWTNNVISWRIRPQNSVIGLSRQIPNDADVINALRNAFKAWSDVTPLEFVQVNSNAAEIQIRFAVDAHGDPSPFDGRGGTLAHAYYNQLPSQIHFDDDERWTNTRQAFNFQLVATHEIGHVLGLGHSQVVDAVMFATYPRTFSSLGLHQDDIRGIQRIYGENTEEPEEETTTTTTTTTTTPSTTAAGTTRQVTDTTRQETGTTRQVTGTTRQVTGTTRQVTGSTRQRTGTRQVTGTTGQATGITRQPTDRGTRPDFVTTGGLARTTGGFPTTGSGTVFNRPRSSPQPGTDNGRPRSSPQPGTGNGFITTRSSRQPTGGIVPTPTFGPRLRIGDGASGQRPPFIKDQEIDVRQTLKDDFCKSNDMVIIDAITSLPNDGPTLVFTGSVFSVLNEDELGAPRTISEHFTGTVGEIDAALSLMEYSVSTGVVAIIYIFKGTEVCQYGVHGESWLLLRSTLIAEKFPGLPDNIDAAFYYKQYRAIFVFKGSSYYKIEHNLRGLDEIHTVAIGYPKPISKWGLPASSPVSTAFTWNTNSLTYFFLEDTYYRFNDIEENVDTHSPLPFPRKVKDWWFGCVGENQPRPRGGDTVVCPPEKDVIPVVNIGSENRLNENCWIIKTKTIPDLSNSGATHQWVASSLMSYMLCNWISILWSGYF